jgi:hypothetical protein
MTSGPLCSQSREPGRLEDHEVVAGTRDHTGRRHLEGGAVGDAAGRGAAASERDRAPVRIEAGHDVSGKGDGQGDAELTPAAPEHRHAAPRAAHGAP